MKLLTTFTITLLATSHLYSQTTMCFKDNHSSMSTIENTKLDGGECKSNFSLNQMKSKGWKVEDIKVIPKNNAYNFIYILKKQEQKIIGKNTDKIASPISQEILENNIIKKIEKKKEKEKKVQKEKELALAKDKGQKLYLSQCASCHGQKGEESAYNVSLPLKDLSVKDMSFSIGQYTNRTDFGYGYQSVMSPIAASVTVKKLRMIKEYLNSVNN